MALKPDAILAVSYPALRAAEAETRIIPIVMCMTEDAVKESYVKKRSEEISQTLPGFKTDAGNLRRGRNTLGNDCILAVAAEGWEQSGLTSAPPRRRAATTCRQKIWPPCGQNAVRGQPRFSHVARQSPVRKSGPCQSEAIDPRLVAE